MYDNVRVPGDVSQLTLSTTAARAKVVPGERLLLIPSVACAIAFGDNTTTPSLTGQVMATGTLTSSGAFTDDQTVVINGVTYTSKTTLSTDPAVAYEFLIGANQTASHLNLKKAINGEGTVGTHYSAGTLQHPDVWCVSSDGTTNVVLAKYAGTRGNLITTTETQSNVAWGATTLASGAGLDGQINLVAGFPVIICVPSYSSQHPANRKAVAALAAIAGGAGTLAIIRV
jgi:hypothetical protein